MQQTVIAAMSGGVDSSVAAALLLSRGYRVIGITLNVWPNEETSCARTCCSVTDVDDARRVCEKLGIPHYVLNMRDLFRERVIDYFIDEYARGRTPNPCIACNTHIKFGALLRRAEELGAQYVATGHYARVEGDTPGKYRLLRSADARKDQTYVLYTLTQEKLAHLLLPCGGFTKPEIREVAERYGLPTSHKADSQDLCFIGSEGYAGFLRANCPALARPGNVIGPSGEILGRHDGVYQFTIGQHKGLGRYTDDRLFVTGINAETSEVLTGHGGDLMSGGMLVEQLSEVVPGSLTGAQRGVGVKIRYAAPETRAVIRPAEGGSATVRFETPQRAVTPGQAAVFYDGESVLGGGIIARPLGQTDL